MVYEIWDTESGTLLGSFRTEAEALTVVQVNVEKYGATYVAAWAVGRLNDPAPVLEGSALVERARNVASLRG